MTASTGGRQPSALSSIKVADLCGQIAQRAYPNRRNAVRIEIVLLDDAPRTTADQRGLHPGLRSWPDVIVQAVTHVQGLTGRARHFTDQTGEEAGRGLTHTQSSEVATISTGRSSSRKILLAVTV